MSERLRASALSAGYGALDALHGVEAVFRAGAAIALLGENGSGKSTLLKVLAGVVTPRAGRVLLDGRPMAELGRRELALRLAYLPQSFEPFFPATAEELVLLGRTPRLGLFGTPTSRDRDAVARSLAEMDATGLAGADIQDMSGGERQRVLLARVLAGGTEILLLDEPTANLDPRHRLLVVDAIRRRAASGGTIVFSTHELDAASHAADEAVLLSKGLVLGSGPLDEVFSERLLSELFGVPASVTRGVNARPVVSFGPAADRAAER